MKVIKSKKQHELALRIVANYLIGKDAICRASTGDSMTMEQVTDALDHLTQNTIEILIGIVGLGDLEYYTNRVREDCKTDLL